jgi:hypothetical protein
MIGPEPVIGPGHFRTVTSDGVHATSWPASNLLRWDESTADFLAEVPPAEQRAALRQIEREVARWREQQTDAQACWSRRESKTPYHRPIAAAQAIVEHLGPR